MEFRKLFNAQKALMERIEKEHPPVEGENRFKKRALALLVEVGECANEFRGFKFWSKDQNPRLNGVCEMCDGQGIIFSEDCPKCEGSGFDENKNPLLEELVDVLHFILEMGLVTNKVDYKFLEKIQFPDVAEMHTTEFFLDLYDSISKFIEDPTFSTFEQLMEDFIYLASALGFEWEEVVDAYFDKNQINHRRQENGY